MCGPRLIGAARVREEGEDGPQKAREAQKEFGPGGWWRRWCGVDYLSLIDRSKLHYKRSDVTPIFAEPGE